MKKQFNILTIRSVLLITLIIPFALMPLSSCQKYLDAKPDKSLVTPQTVQDLQGLLDYFPFINNQCSDICGVAADNYFLTDAVFQSFPDNMKTAYLWQDGMFNNTPDWQNEYTVVYNANVVLDNLKNIDRTAINATAWNNCKGSALVFRAKSFWEIAQIWAKAYDSTTENQDLGIPLRLTSDFNVKSVRSTMKETYDQIINDLMEAIPLLPDLPVTPFRPSKCAAYGLLARTYLTMRNYTEAGLYADSCLQLNGNLLDYNSLDSTSANPFPSISVGNPEDIFHTTTQWFRYNLYPAYTNMDTTLLSLYTLNDLRKSLFFNKNVSGSYSFKGSYDGTIANYNGIATDEMYLIRAECYAREGKVSLAMNDLNTLLIKRWKRGTFIPYTISNAEDALKLILTERRKELVCRMLRFTDIKRLNKEGAGIILKRIINGQEYTLPPNDPRYALPIPENVIQLTGMQQN